MGMFDWVEYECNCPNCGDLVTGFQTKEGDCVLDTLQPEDVDYFYSFCNTCNLKVEPKAKNAEELLAKELRKYKESYLNTLEKLVRTEAQLDSLINSIESLTNDIRVECPCMYETDYIRIQLLLDNIVRKAKYEDN